MTCKERILSDDYFDIIVDFSLGAVNTGMISAPSMWKTGTTSFIGTGINCPIPVTISMIIGACPSYMD